MSLRYQSILYVKIINGSILQGTIPIILKKKLIDCLLHYQFGLFSISYKVLSKRNCYFDFMKSIFPLSLLLFGSLLLYSLESPFYSNNHRPSNLKVVEKINGVNFVAPPKEISENLVRHIKTESSSEWVALLPYSFLRSGSKKLVYDREQQWWGQKTEGIIATANFAKRQGLKVMIRPMIWIGWGAYTGEIEFDNESDWQTWEKSFEQYIIHYAKICDSLNLDLLCMGTELRQFVTKRPKYWSNLITKIRNVYKGNVTYAANWDDYQTISFWAKLDYISIDTYFPLAEEKTPSVNYLNLKWSPIKIKIKNLSSKHNKPVLFTEYGYRSMDYNTKKPWESHRSNHVNLQAQENAYISLYQTFWDEPWFAGGFLWKWHSDHDRAGGKENADFTPQNKPVIKIIKEWYSRSNPNK